MTFIFKTKNRCNFQNPKKTQDAKSDFVESI